jgi:hypothetical protein
MVMPGRAILMSADPEQQPQALSEDVALLLYD